MHARRWTGTLKLFMSYESNWGFTDPTDEFGAHVPLHDYGSGSNFSETYQFVVKIEINDDLKDSLDGCSYAERFSVLQIVSDFEPISAMMVISVTATLCTSVLQEVSFI